MMGWNLGLWFVFGGEHYSYNLELRDNSNPRLWKLLATCA